MFTSTGFLSSRSRATALSRAADHVAQLEPWIPRRIPKAEHWKSTIMLEDPRRRQTRIDSKFEPRLPRDAGTSLEDKSYFFALPAAIRSAIYQHILTEDEPIQPAEATATSYESTPLNGKPLVLAFPAIEEEIVQHVPYYLRCNTFTFDVRTEQGLLGFQAWCSTLGTHAWNIRSLTLKHWTAYWGLSQNQWIPLEDSTDFSYNANGDIVASRTATTPRLETCRCHTILPMLARFDRNLDLQRFHSIAKIQQLVACLRTRVERSERLTLVDASKIFVAMLDEHSRLVARMYGLAGDACSGCNMPRAYLCGHLSTHQMAHGSGIAFDAKASCKRG